MKRFTGLVSGAVKKAGGKFLAMKTKAKDVLKKVKSLARSSHLFAKDQEQKSKVGKKMSHSVKDLHDLLAGLIGEAERKLHAKSSIERERLNQVMGKLLPQILYFLETGFVASKKIIHLQMSELYAIVRGKSGKSVEFGLKRGINRISGFAMGFLMESGNVSDKKFCIKSIQEHIEMFGVAPNIFWIRPWWLQPEEYKQSQKTWSSSCGDRSNWQNSVVSLRAKSRGDPTQASPSRRYHRRSEIKKISIQQARCEINTINGDLRPSLLLGLQIEQNVARTANHKHSYLLMIENLGHQVLLYGIYPQTSAS